MNYFLVSIVTIVVTYLFSRYLSDPAARLYVLDHPNQRSLHSESRPRNGGIAIISSFILGYTLIRFMVYQEIPGEAHIWSGLAILIIISFIDDKSPLPPWQRFLVQTGAVVVLLFGGLAATNLTIPGLGLFEMGWFGPIFSAIFVIWMMNLSPRTVPMISPIIPRAFRTTRGTLQAGTFLPRAMLIHSYICRVE